MKQRKLTFAEFATLCEVSVSTAHGWASGRHAARQCQIATIAKVLRIDPAELVS